jgi:NADPH:quinone reductase-like Zn-dependent oxidoreductase
VTATASTQEKLDWLLNMPNGATNTANYETEDFSTVIKAVTNGKGVDAIIDFVGKTHWKKNIDSLAVDGRMTMLGLLSGMSITECPKTPKEVRIIVQNRFPSRFLRS